MPVKSNIWGDAANGADFETIPETITIPAGQSSVNLTIKPLEDILSEGTEFLAVGIESEYLTYLVDPQAPAKPPSQRLVLRFLPRLLQPTGRTSLGQKIGNTAPLLTPPALIQR